MWWIAKAVQALCIVTLLYALYAGVVEGKMGRELSLLILGGATFLAARHLEKQVSP